MTKKVKNILFKIDLTGKGIVNYDSENQKYLWNQLENREFVGKENNVSFAKKNFYFDDDGKLKYKIKISSDALRHMIFEGDFQFQSPNIMENNGLLLAAIASPAAIMRGYLFAVKGRPTLRRTSPLCISDAEQTCSAVSNLETFSKSGKKVQDENKADTSFFKRETVGNIEYSADGHFSFSELQFLSTDEIFDRLAVNPDTFPLYKILLKTRVPSFDSNLGFFQKKGSCVEIPEYGALFSSEDISFILKDTLVKIFNIKSYKAKAFVEVSKMKIKPVYDPAEDKMNSEEGWIEINSVEDINALDFEFETFFVEENKDRAELLREEIRMEEAATKQRNKEEKAAEAAKKKKDKEGKAAEAEANDENK